ncbi:hypothetical protein [Kitasatospora sp. NPDC017646]|uniref:hypothetical protein n=1 Tax=Kitasatospora sp. NPDC017646 TaxID=3364024 RepID=UPI0037BD4376
MKLRRSIALGASALALAAGAIGSTGTAEATVAQPLWFTYEGCQTGPQDYLSWTLQACLRFYDDGSVTGTVYGTAPSTSTDVRLYVELYKNCGNGWTWVTSDTSWGGVHAYPPSGWDQTPGPNAAGCHWQSHAWLTESGVTRDNRWSSVV